jgi:hypothetical protein
MIKAPNWQKDAIPTRNGWVHPRRNELLLARPISQADIDEYLGVTVVEEEPTVGSVTVGSVTVDSVIFTDKDELEIYAIQEYEIDLNKRKSLKNMAKELYSSRASSFNTA